MGDPSDRSAPRPNDAYIATYYALDNARRVTELSKFRCRGAPRASQSDHKNLIYKIILVSTRAVMRFFPHFP